VIKLQQFANDKMAIINAAGDRFTYESQQTQTKRKKEEVEEEERLQMAQIDWNEFVIAETMNLFDDDELPTTFRPDVAQSDPISEQISTGPSSNQYLPRKQAGPGSELSGRKVGNILQICPVCGRKIDVSEFNEHLRIEMSDPNYRIVKTENISTVSGDDMPRT